MKAIICLVFIALIAVSNAKLTYFGMEEDAPKSVPGTWGPEYLKGFIKGYSGEDVLTVPPTCGSKAFEDEVIAFLKELMAPSTWMCPIKAMKKIMAIFTTEISENCGYEQISYDHQQIFMFMDSWKMADYVVRLIIMSPILAVEKVAFTATIFMGDYFTAGQMGGYVIRKAVKGLWA